MARWETGTGHLGAHGPANLAYVVAKNKTLCQTRWKLKTDDQMSSDFYTHAVALYYIRTQARTNATQRHTLNNYKRAGQGGMYLSS